MTAQPPAAGDNEALAASWKKESGSPKSPQPCDCVRVRRLMSKLRDIQPMGAGALIDMRTYVQPGLTFWPLLHIRSGLDTGS